MARHALASATPSHTFLDPTWWTAAAQRAAYTTIAAVVPLALLLVAGEVPLLFVLSTAAVAFVLSIATSLAGLPEVTDRQVPAWLAILIRVVKTVAQVLASALVSVQLITDVPWAEVWQLVAGAALVTFLRGILSYLPETARETPEGTVIPADATLHIYDAGGVLLGRTTGDVRRL